MPVFHESLASIHNFAQFCKAVLKTVAQSSLYDVAKHHSAYSIAVGVHQQKSSDAVHALVVAQHGVLVRKLD